MLDLLDAAALLIGALLRVEHGLLEHGQLLLGLFGTGLKQGMLLCQAFGTLGQLG